MTNADLRIPYGLTKSQEMVYPTGATRDTNYFCPECSGRLVFRSGNKVRPHFAHYRIPENCRFLNEGWLHISAKHAVLSAIFKWLLGEADSPRIQRTCRNRNCTYEQELPPSVKHVRMEHRVHTPLGHYVADVALLDAAEHPICIIEILDTHAVDEEKEQKLGDMPWIEVKATDALMEPTLWKPIRHQNLKGTDCPDCREAKRNATKMPVIQRGLAIHVDYCPIRARVWKGKPYANVIDDCSGCQYNVGGDVGPTYNRFNEVIAYGATAIYCVGPRGGQQ